MREIKFRAWDKEYNRMLEWGKYIKGITIGGIKTVENYNSEDGWSDTLNLKEIILMQYTGLKDKNGKGIYEGDIVEKTYYSYHQPESSEIFEVKYETMGFAFKRLKGTPYHAPFAEELEIIGNIYENPELLECGRMNKQEAIEQLKAAK